MSELLLIETYRNNDRNCAAKIDGNSLIALLPYSPN